MTQLFVERNSHITLIPVYEKRRPIIKAIENFWPVALLNHSIFAFHVSHQADQVAFSYLEDLWVQRDATEPRCFTIEFVSRFPGLHLFMYFFD